MTDKQTEMTTAESPEAVPIHVALARVAADIGAIAKNLKNEDAGYAARSIDDVLDKIHDPLARHGVVLLPEVKKASYQVVNIGRNSTPMREATLTIRWRFVGPMGDHLDAVTCGEALDSGDKATNKAQSASLKYALLHVFTIPIKSGDAEADAASPERAAAPEEPTVPMATKVQLDAVVTLGKQLKELGVDVGKWPTVLGVTLLRNKRPVATVEQVDTLITVMQARVAELAPDAVTRCVNCEAVATADTAIAFNDDGAVILCTSCPAEAREAWAEAAGVRDGGDAPS